MNRISSRGSIKVTSRDSVKINYDKARRSTNTKASAERPSVYNISAARYKQNNGKQTNLFHSSSKCNKQNQNYLQLQPQNKQQPCKVRQAKQINKNQSSILLRTCQQINKKMSVQYINSLYSDILVQIIYQLNQQNYLKAESISINDQSVLMKKLRKMQTFKHTIHNSIKQNIGLKQRVNKAYKGMTEAESLISYLKQEKPKLISKMLDNCQHHSDQIQMIIQTFISFYNQTEQQLNKLNHAIKWQENQPKCQQNISQNQLKQKQLKLAQLKSQLEKQQKINQKYQREEKYLLTKLYSYQNQSLKTVGSLATLKIKLNNLQNTIKFRQTSKPKLGLSLSLKNIKSNQPIQESKQSFRSVNLNKNGNQNGNGNVHGNGNGSVQIQRSMSLTNLKRQFGRIKRFQITNQQKTMLKNSESLKLLPKIAKQSLLQKHSNNYFNKIH